MAEKKLVSFQRFVRCVAAVSSNLSLQPKMKIVISFYQVFSTFDSIYGVSLHRRFTAWLNVLSIMNFNAMDFILPGKCVGSMQKRLAANALWPILAGVVLIFSITVHALLWVVLAPLVCTGLVLWVQPSVRKMHITDLANACRFLWRDYDSAFLYWEVIDLARKLILTALILFVDTEFGESRLLRLVLAAVLTAMYLAILALARPFKYAEDLYLACIGNLLLACCFISGIAIKLCEGQAWKDSCQAFLGITDSYNASMFVVALTIVMLVVAIFVIIAKAFTSFTTSTIRLVSSGREPILELPAGCDFHCFLSHTWRTGQDQTHTVARQLQLLLPSANIWLDVDNLDDVGKLEQAVAESAVIIIFLSKDYFCSKNCCRELYTALALDKPIVAVLETDTDKGGATKDDMIAECQRCCVDVALYKDAMEAVEKLRTSTRYAFARLPAKVKAKVFTLEPVVWVRVHDFQVESLKLIAHSMLESSPYYQRNPQELQTGLKVSCELGPFGFVAPIHLLVCSANAGAQSVANEVKTAALEGQGGAEVKIKVADIFLDLVTAAPDGRSVPEGTVLLLYLNDKTFLDSDEKTVHDLVKKAMDLKIPIAPVHEQDAAKGGCAFGLLFEQTPQDLQQRKLFDTLAVPLFPMPDHRKISLRHILRGMGAKRMEAKNNSAPSVELTFPGPAIAPKLLVQGTLGEEQPEAKKLTVPEPATGRKQSTQNCSIHKLEHQASSENCKNTCNASGITVTSLQSGLFSSSESESQQPALVRPHTTSAGSGLVENVLDSLRCKLSGLGSGSPLPITATSHTDGEPVLYPGWAQFCTSQPVSQYSRRMSIEAESSVAAPSLSKCGHANQPAAFEEDIDVSVQNQLATAALQLEEAALQPAELIGWDTKKSHAVSSQFREFWA